MSEDAATPDVPTVDVASFSRLDPWLCSIVQRLAGDGFNTRIRFPMFAGPGEVHFTIAARNRAGLRAMELITTGLKRARVTRRQAAPLIAVVHLPDGDEALFKV